jgi:hypothetical protein
MKFGHKGYLNIRTSFKNRLFPNPMIFLLILDELKNLGFGRMRRNP